MPRLASRCTRGCAATGGWSGICWPTIPTLPPCCCPAGPFPVSASGWCSRRWRGRWAKSRPRAGRVSTTAGSWMTCWPSCARAVACTAPRISPRPGARGSTRSAPPTAATGCGRSRPTVRGWWRWRCCRSSTGWARPARSTGSTATTSRSRPRTSPTPTARPSSPTCRRCRAASRTCSTPRAWTGRPPASATTAASHPCRPRTIRPAVTPST